MLFTIFLLIPTVFACEPLNYSFDNKLASKYAPVIELNENEQFNLDRTLYRIFELENSNISEKTTIIEYWFEWDYSKAFWYENLFALFFFGKKFDHFYDLEPIFVTIKNDKIIRIEFDSKHYIRGTINFPQLIKDRPLIRAIKNSHGFIEPKLVNNTLTNYELVELSKEEEVLAINIIEQIPFPLNIEPILNDPTCWGEVTKGIWKYINKLYGDKEGKTFYQS